MTSRLDELIACLRDIDLPPTVTLSALRVPSNCDGLSAVATACEPSLTRLCDYRDAQALLEARDVIRATLRLLQSNRGLSKNDHRSLRDAPGVIDNAYRALPLYQSNEPWWKETIREALIARLILSPADTPIAILTDALSRDLPVTLPLHHRQNDPSVRIALLIDCLAFHGTSYSKLIGALGDTAAVLGDMPALRKEVLHPDNSAQLEELRRQHTTPTPKHSSRERLHRLARNIAVTALAQRREFHAPPSQQLATIESLNELTRRSSRWNEPERVALHAILLLGRLGYNLLHTSNQDPHCRIKHHFHEVWIERQLPDAPEFTRHLDGPGFEPVGRLLQLPLPRHFGHALADVLASQERNQTLHSLERKLRELSRDGGQQVTIRRIRRGFEHELEQETPDEALMTLLGVQAEARRDASIHYFAPSATLLSERFRSASERLIDRLGLDVLTEGWSVPPSAPTTYVGYSYRADTALFGSFIAKIQSLAELGRGRTSSQRVLDAYNARVARLALMFLAATGSRPTGSVLPRRGEISLEDRAAIVSDKDSIDYRSTRLIPLCDRLIAEIRDFERWAASKNLLPRTITADTPLAMLQAKDGSLCAPTISAIVNTLPGLSLHWPWPDDMLRHLFRSRLWEKGCPSSWLRRVMGHHPPHGSADMPWSARPLWEGLHHWTAVIDDYLGELGF